jgi:hypothetical protein
MMEAVRTSETSVYFNETTLHNIPDGYYLWSSSCSMLSALDNFHVIFMEESYGHGEGGDYLKWIYKMT